MITLDFTIHLTDNATVVACCVCATLAWFAWVSLQRSKHGERQEP